MAKDLSILLENTIRKELPELRAFDSHRASVRPAGPQSWSPKEELGHLIDSACNNHVRFVRASFEPEFQGPSYAQNSWVEAHAYDEMQWADIVSFWFEYNKFLARVTDLIPSAKLETLCTVGTGPAVTLRFLIEDYILHMQHHIDHLLGRQSVTAYPAAPTSKT